MLEDEFGDVVAKARRGLGLAIEDVAQNVGLEPRMLEAVEACRELLPEPEVRAIAKMLRLRPEPLLDLAQGRWEPVPVASVAGPWRLRMLTLSNATGFTSNTYLLWHEGDRECTIVDPGFESEAIVAAIEAEGLQPRLVAVTHGHHDHVGEAGALARRYGIATAIGVEDLPIVPAGARSKAFGTVAEGDRLPFGRHHLEVHAAPGHTAGGRVYAVEGISFVGDTLFAASIGRTFGGPPDYPIHLDTVRGILAGDPVTRLCPGHGPQTTVAEEREHNPFA